MYPSEGSFLKNVTEAIDPQVVKMMKQTNDMRSFFNVFGLFFSFRYPVKGGKRATARTKILHKNYLHKISVI